MKKVLTAALLALSIGSVSAQTKLSEVSRFAPQSIQLGTLKQGVPATATFTVTNTSSRALTIEKVIPACGCTLADYTKSPIPPGKTGTITATYNAAAVGTFSKSVNVKFAGIEELATLGISGEVKPASTTASSQ